MKQKRNNNTYRNRHGAVKMTAITLLLAMILVLPGCQAGQEKTVALHIQLENGEPESRSLLPGTPLTVSYYTVSGDGPGEESFDISTQDSVTTIPGLEVGSWNISAYGWNENGVRLIAGSTSLNLTPDNNQVAITLDEYYGTGTISIVINWDDALVFSPELHLYLTPQGDAETEVFPTIGAGSASYQTTLAAGTYILRCELISGGETVAGCLEAVRITDQMISSGTVSLNLNTMKSDISVSLTDKSAVPITGSITGLPASPVAGESATLTYTAENVAVEDLPSVTVDWYLDGIFKSSGATYTCTFVEGIHRVDALAVTPEAGSAGSASITFTALQPDTGGTLTVLSILDDNTGGTLLDGSEFVAIAPDGLIINAGKIDDAIQTFRIENDTLVLKQTIEDSLENPLNGVSQIAVSQDGLIVGALSDYAKSLSFYSHTPGTDTIEVIEVFTSPFTIDGAAVTAGLLSGIYIDSNSGNIYITDRLEERIYHFYYSGTEVVPIDYYTIVTDPAIDSMRRIAHSPDGSRMAIPCYGSSSLLIMSIDPVTGVPSIETMLSYLATGTMGLGTVNFATFLDDTTILTTSNEFLCEFTYGPPAAGEPDSWYQTQRIKEDVDVAIMSGPKYISFNSDKSSLYVSDSITNGLTTFRRDLTTGLLYYNSFLSFEPGDPAMSVMTPDGLYLIAPSAVTDQLYLLEITQ